MKNTNTGGSIPAPPENTVIDACIDATGEAPPAEQVLSKIGRWLRFGKSKNYALKLHEVDGGYVYIIQDHVKDETVKGSTTKKGETYTPEQKREFAKHRHQLEQQRRDKLARKDRMLSAMAKRLWLSLLPPESRAEPFPYMAKKRETVRNARYLVTKKRDVLVLPMVCPFGGLKSLYIIDKKGFKRPLLGTATTGLMMAISDAPLDQARRFGVVEGYATGLAASELFNVPIVVAFTCHNLAPVIEKLRRKYPSAELTLYADNDVDTFSRRGFNPGVDAAKKVQAQFPDVEIVIPKYPERASGLSDWNDLKNYLEDHGNDDQSGGLGDG